MGVGGIAVVTARVYRRYARAMIAWIEGVIESIEGMTVVVCDHGLAANPIGAGALRTAFEILVPAYFAERMQRDGRIGARQKFVTIQYLEGQAQGAWFIPRVLGFPSASDRRFFELLTTVDGMGNKKALRAMAREPGEIAGAILSKNVSWLTSLPEIGKKTAEKIVLELASKVGPFIAMNQVVGTGMAAEAKPTPVTSAVSQGEREAMAALVELGESPAEAARLVAKAIAISPALAIEGASCEAILAAVYARRG